MPPCLGRPVRVSVSVHMSSVRPSSDRRPVGIRCPRVRCPVSGVGVRCPVRASGIHVYFVRTGEFVERLGAAASHTSRDRLGR
jgi:hypothetical protein